MPRLRRYDCGGICNKPQWRAKAWVAVDRVIAVDP